MEKHELNKKILELIAEYFKGFNTSDYEILSAEKVQRLLNIPILSLENDEVIIGCKNFRAPDEECLTMYFDSESEKFYCFVAAELMHSVVQDMGYYQCLRFKSMPDWLFKFFAEIRSDSEQARDILKSIDPKLVS